MFEAIADLLHAAVTSPWVYLALFTAAALDGFLPVVPGESLVITAGVFAASGEPNLAAVIAVAALGAFLGDHVSYLLGRKGGRRLIERLPPHSKKRAPFNWASRTLEERGGLVLVICRYIPGLRTATTITLGTVAYPLRRFAAFDVIAAVTWAVYSTLIGYLGGYAFEEDPIKGVAFGIGLALVIAGIVEAVRYLHRRRAPEPGERELIHQ